MSWQIKPLQYDSLIIDDIHGETIATIYGDPENNRNAKLIIQAQEMYSIMNWLEGFLSIQKKGRIDLDEIYLIVKAINHKIER